MSITLMGFVSRGLLRSCTFFFSFFSFASLRPPPRGYISPHCPPHALLCLLRGPTCIWMDVRAEPSAFCNRGVPQKRKSYTARTGQSLREDRRFYFYLLCHPTVCSVSLSLFQWVLNGKKDWFGGGGRALNASRTHARHE